MKTIVQKSTGLSKYLLDDDIVVEAKPDIIVIGYPQQFFIADLNKYTTIIYEGVTAPSDWIGDKYTFDGTDWTLNPNWVEPSVRA